MEVFKLWKTYLESWFFFCFDWLYMFLEDLITRIKLLIHSMDAKLSCQIWLIFEGKWWKAKESFSCFDRTNVIFIIPSNVLFLLKSKVSLEIDYKQFTNGFFLSFLDQWSGLGHAHMSDYIQFQHLSFTQDEPNSSKKSIFQICKKKFILLNGSCDLKHTS